jgi:hypothetical protein
MAKQAPGIQGITRHYLLEVYYPQSEVWVTVEPQDVLGRMTNGNIYLYDDPDWNQAKHVETRNFSRDDDLGVSFEVGKPSDSAGN